MNLILPDVSVTIGPDWAALLNAALLLVDAHDHAVGNGVKITPTGMNVNADLTFTNHAARALRLVELTALVSSPTDQGVVYRLGNNLYYNNASGVPVQITAGNIVNAPGSGAFSVNVVSSYPYTVVNSDAQKVLIIDTSAARTVNLPPAPTAIFFTVKDGQTLAQTNPITVVPDGGDVIDGLNSNYTIDWNDAAVGFISDGVSSWYVV